MSDPTGDDDDDISDYESSDYFLEQLLLLLSLRTADVFPVVASLPPKNVKECGFQKEYTTKHCM